MEYSAFMRGYNLDISSSEKAIIHRSQADISWIKFALFSAVVSLFLAYSASAVPQITYQQPTLTDNTATGANWVFINVTSSEDLNQSLLEWGNSSGFTNVSMYNFSMTNWYVNMTDLADGTYNYTIFAKNATGDWNQTQRRWISVDTTQPYIDFIPPSDSDNAIVSRNWSYVNSSASDATNITTLIDFNRSLVGWWRFNREAGENDTFVRDWSTYGNNGTIYNTNPGIENCTGNCSGWTSSGKFGNALQFDGVDDYASATINQNHDVFTITAWIKISATAREQHFAEFGNTQFYVGSNNKLGTSAWSTASGSKTLSKNVWYFAALVRNNTNVSLYLDGEKDGNDGTLGTNPTNSFFIGNIYTLTGNYNFNGTIDEVQVWNRALNPEEINASYNTGLYRLYHNFTNLTDGIYTYTAYAQDLAGNVNQTETRTLTIDTTTPSYSLNNTNSTYAGRDTLFSLYWTDNALSAYIFSFDNGTGVYVNESGTLSGTSNYTNITKHINTTAGSIIRWLIYVNDTAGNTNMSGTHSFTTTEAPSLIITMSLANNTLNPDDSAYLSGQASYMNGTNVTGIIIDIYLDGERIDGWVDEEFIWWDYSWMYKDKVIINGSPTNLSDYSVSITVNWTSGMNNSFDDLRFTYHNKTTNTELEIPYWIEKKYNGINATVWIRTDLTEGNNTINIYYGNPVSESESDGDSFFDLLEDWETGTVNTYRWTSGGSTSPYWITYTSTSYDGTYSSGNNDISDSQLSWTKRTVSVSSQSMLEFYWKVSSESGYDYLYYCIDNDECTYSSGYISRIAGSVDWTKVNYTLTPSQHSIKFGYRKDGAVSTGFDTGWIDAIKIRKYTVPEPAILTYELYNITHWINATGGYSSVFKVPKNAGTHTLRVNSTGQNGTTGENTTEFTSRIYIDTGIHTVSKGARYAAPDDEINISGVVYRSLNGDIDSVWVNITDPDNQSKVYYLDNATAKNETGTWYKIINVSTEFSNTLGTYNSTFYANDTTGMVSSIPARSFWFTVQTGTIDMSLDYSVLVPFQTMKVSGQSVAAQKTVYIIMNDTYNTAATTQLNDTSSAKNVTLNASQSRTEYIRLPKYADITSVSFDIKGYAYNNSYPRNPSVDIGADNDNEFWGAGTYNGTLFLQDRFTDNLQLHNISFYLPDYDISYIRLPKYLSVYNATLNISGNTGPGFSDNASYNKMQNGDLENGTTWWTFFTAHRDTNATGIVKEGNYSAHFTSTLGSYSALWYPESSFKSSVRNKKKFYTMWYYPIDLTADYIDLPSITQSQVSGPQLCYFMPRNTTGNLYSKGGSSVSFRNPMNTTKWYKIQLLCNPSVSEAILWIDNVKIARATGTSYTESYVGIWLADPWVGNAGWGNAYMDGMFLSVDDAVFTPENITLNIGNDSDIEFNITGVFNTSNSPQKIEFRDEIISNIDSCTASVDSKGNVYCDVPINATSQSAGNVALTVLNLTYNYSSSTFSSMLLDYKTAINKYLSSCTSDQSGYCNVPIVFASDSQGALEISNINITYIADYLGKTETDADGAYSTYINAPKYPDQYNVSVFLFDSGVSLGSNMTNITVVADTALTLISITTPIDADAGKLLWSDYQQAWDGADVNNTTSSLTISLWNSTGYLVVDNASMSYNSTNSRWEYNYNLTYLGIMNFTVYANSWESVNGQPMVNQSASSHFDAQNISISIDADKKTYNPEENITITGIALLQPYLRNVSSNTIYIYLDETKLLYKTETGYIESGGTSNLATDGNGSYRYILKSPLESGTYTIKINITNSNGTYGVNSTQFMTQISVKNKKAISPQTLTSHANKNQMVNISSTIYRNIDNPIQTVWVNVTIPDSTTYTYYLDNTTSRALTGTWFKSLNVSLEFGDLLGLYNITFYANSTLSNGSAISQQLPAPETSFYIDSMQTNLNLNRQPQIYGNGGNMTVLGNIVLNTDDGNQSNHVISIHVNNTMMGWCNESNDSCISGNGYYIPAFGGTWKYIKQITINNAGNPDSLHNYQVPVNISYNANMQADFDDIRFAWYNYSSRQDMKIPYFVENKTDSSWAYVWMKIPYIPADSTTKIYLYYGNNTAINESDENATFISGEIEPLTLNTKTSWSSSYDPYNVNNHDTRAQSIYRFTDFIDAKLVPVKITKLVYPAYQTPGQSLTSYRIRMQKTSIIQNNGNFNASNWTVSWGPTTHSVTGGTSYNYTLTSVFYWTKDNLLIDLSRDGTSYTGSGSMYVRTNSLTARTCSYTSDSSRTWPFDGTCTNIDYVPVVVFSGLLRNYSAPEPTVISIGPEQPALLTDATGNYNYSIRTDVTDGIYTIKVNITDINGIYSENETSFEIDNTQPEMSISSPDIKRTHYNYAPEVIGICTDKNNVSHIWTNITQYNTSQISVFNLTNISALSEQVYDVNITCNDTLGNQKSYVFSFTYDAKAPDISFIPQTDDNDSYLSRNWSYVNISITDMLSPENQTAFIDFNNSLVGWWRFNRESGENDTYVRDWSTYGNNGTLANMNPGIDNCTLNCSGWTTNGKFGNGMRLDGVNDYVIVDGGASLNITQSITIELWVKTNVDTNGRVIQKHAVDYGQDYGWMLGRWADTDSFEFKISTTGSNWMGGLSTDNSFLIDTWYHVVGTYDNQYMRIYINGVENTAESFPYALTGNINPVYNPLLIGVEGTNSSYDEVRIWNRALSPEEINASYNSGLYRLYHNFTNLSDGTHTYTAYAQDLAGNVNQTGTRTLIIDTLAPLVQTILPENKIYNSTAMTLNYTASDANLNTVWYNYNGTDTIVTGNISLTALDNQQSTLTLYANDTAGNINSSSVTFTTDTASSSVSLIEPLPDYNTSSSVVSFTFNVTDNLNTSMECSLYINGTLITTNSSTANATETTFQNMPVSSTLNQNWTVSCTDGINTNTPEERTFNIDNIAPEDNSPPDASYEQGTEATIGWTLTDNYAPGYYRIYRNTSQLQNDTASWTNSTILNVWINTTAIGTWNYTITYNDSIGNIGTQDEVIITIISSDMTPPAVTIHSPSNTTYSTDPELNFTYTEAEPEKCWYSLNSGSNQTLASCSSNNTTLTSVYGSNNVILYMNDTTGNMNSTQKYWTYDNLGPNYTDNITSEESPATYSPSLSIQFDITVTDQYSPIDTVFLEFNGTNYTTTDITSNYTRTLSGIPVGTYNYRWHMNDTLGNMNTTPALTYTINKAATTLILLLNGNDADQAYYAPASVNATYTSDNNESTISMYRNGSMLTLSGATNISQYQSDATYNYTITAYESQNYTSASASHMLTLFATLAPNITGWQNNITNNQSLTITINETQSIFFNITATEPVNYAWSLDSVDQSQNIPNFTYANTEPGTHSIKVNISNINDTDEITWTLMVKDIPDINSVQESIDPISLGSIIAIEANITDLDRDLSGRYIVIDGTWYEMQQNGQDRYLANFTPSTEKIYTYYIYANDTTGLSSNTTLYTFTSEQDPTINDVSVTPSSGNESTNFFIQANITDFISISTAYARFTQPEVFEIALANISDIYNTTYSSTTPGKYIFYIWSNDTLGASSSSANHNFTISDTTPPNISAVSITPEQRDETTIITITVNATDHNLTSVYATITGPANSTRTLDSIGDNQYSSTVGIIPHKPGIYTVETIATDAYGNNATMQTNYTINDTQAPILNSLIIIPTISNLDTNFTISANITDNDAVNSTIANITKPDSVSDTVLLSGTNPYTATFSNTTLLGLYTLYIISNDSTGNTLYSFSYPLGTANFSIADAQPPSINELNATPTSVNTTETITINANVTDDNGVNFVTAEVTRPDLYLIPISTFTNTSEIYTANYTETTIPGRYTIRFNATDIAGKTSTATSDFTAVDTITPQMILFSTDDSTPSVSQEITFTSTSSDNDIINKLNGTINITKPDNTTQLITMSETGSVNQGSPPTYIIIQSEANYTPTIVGNYTAIFTIRDIANNTAQSVITFEAFDTAGPSISSVSIEAAETENITINMTADEESNYTFAYDVGSGWNYASNGSLRLNHTIVIPKYSASTTIQYYINLTDQYGNPGRYPSIDVNNFTVDGTLLFNRTSIGLYLTEKHSSSIQIELRNPSSIPINATINKTKSWTTVPSAKYLNPLQSATININLTPDDISIGDWQATETITAHGSALTTLTITLNIAHAVGDGECDTGEACGTADCPACPASSSGGGSSSSGGGDSSGLPPLKHECETNANCTAAQFCKNYRCTDIRCTPCEYIKDHICAKYECCKDADCNIGYTCKNNTCQKAEEPKPDNIEDTLKIDAQKAILRATRTIIANKLSRDTKKAEAILNEAESAFAGVSYGQAKELAEQAKLLAENAPLLEEKTPKEDTNRLFKSAMIILTILLILVFIKKDLTNKAKAKYKSKDTHRFQRLSQ